ncbi:MAG: Zn-ribbon domain-containing OB-fold protein [Acidimicrobiales bacterium]
MELDEGPRVMTNIVDCDPETLQIGQRVRVVWDDTGQGSALYRFTPT